MRTPSTLEHVQPVMHTSWNQEQVLLCCGRAPQLTEERREEGEEEEETAQNSDKSRHVVWQTAELHVTQLGNGVVTDWLAAAWQVPRINGCRPSGNSLPMICSERRATAFVPSSTSSETTAHTHLRCWSPTDRFSLAVPKSNQSTTCVRRPHTHAHTHTHTTSHDYLEGRPDGRSPG